MRADPDRALLGASLAFAGVAVPGGVVAIRDNFPASPSGEHRTVGASRAAGG